MHMSIIKPISTKRFNTNRKSGLVDRNATSKGVTNATKRRRSVMRFTHFIMSQCFGSNMNLTPSGLFCVEVSDRSALDVRQWQVDFFASTSALSSKLPDRVRLGADISIVVVGIVWC